MQEVLTFEDIEIHKQTFHQQKNISLIKQQYLKRFILVKKDLNILLATKMLKKFRPLCEFLPKMSAYRKDF